MNDKKASSWLHGIELISRRNTHGVRPRAQGLNQLSWENRQQAIAYRRAICHQAPTLSDSRSDRDGISDVALFDFPRDLSV